jgi:MFS family permease
MRPVWSLSAAMFLALVPVTLLVPGLNELVVETHAGSETAAHAFMTVNMLAGMVAVPVLMRRLHRIHNVRRWLAAMFLIDAIAFVGMGRTGSLAGLFLFRAVDGAVHLPAVTLLMVAANRQAGERRGASMGALASALMLGITVGSPLGGWLVERGPAAVYDAGAAIFGVAALFCGLLPATDPARGGRKRGRYVWQWRRLETWPPLGYAFMDRFSIGIFVSTFTLFLARVHQLEPSDRGVLISMFMIPFAVLCYPVGRIAERIGWFPLLVGGNIAFGLVYGAYGFVPAELLPVAMALSGVASALIFAPSLILVSELVRRGHDEGLFGVFQLAGSFGFLIGPIVGGALVTMTGRDGRPSYEQIFVAVGLAELLLAAGTIVLLGRLAGRAKSAEPAPAGENEG